VAERNRDRLGGVAKVVLDLRLVAVLLTILGLPLHEGGMSWLVSALLLAGGTSFVLLWWWDRLGPTVIRHPIWLAIDLGLAAVILAVAGPDSPFLHFTLGTAFLGGLFYGLPGTALFTTLLVGAYAWVIGLRSSVVGEVLLGAPTLYLLAGIAGVLVRRLLDRQAETEVALARERAAAAAAEERARLAREMHDSLAKTLHGIALSARALERLSQRESPAAGTQALALAQAAETAAGEARSLIVDLRTDRLEAPLSDTLATQAYAWSQRTGTPVILDVRPVELECPHVRYELLCICREALTNVERHAGATRVEIALTGDGYNLELRVADDGRGFEPSEAIRATWEGHFGLVGMRERGERAGGNVTVDSTPGAGTTVAARVSLPTVALASTISGGNQR
jgi:signal transduction histidine kinase